MAFGSVCFQVVETEPFKHLFCSCFKVIHDFIKCRSTLVRSGIISKVCKVWSIVFKKQITKIYVKQQRPKVAFKNSWHQSSWEKLLNDKATLGVGPIKECKLVTNYIQRRAEQSVQIWHSKLITKTQKFCR